MINIILAHFNPEFVLSLQFKFQLKLTKGLGRDVKNWVSRWRPWQQSWIFYQLGFSYFVSSRHPDAPYQVSNQLDVVFRGAVQNMNSQHFSHINV